jgi:hypothetical protein
MKTKIEILEEKLGIGSSRVFCVHEIGASAGQPKLKRTRFFLDGGLCGSERIKSRQLCFKRMCDFVDGATFGQIAEKKFIARKFKEIQEATFAKGYTSLQNPEKYYEELGRALAEHFFL